MSKLLKVIVVFISFLVIVFAGLHFWAQDKYVVPIITYHNIDYSKKYSSTMVSPVNFKKQMSFLKKHHYNVISLEELVTSITEKKPVPRKSVVITFDDGAVDNYTDAFPVLRNYGFPATIFVITDVVGKEGYVTWPQLREMDKFGVTTGSHTMGHVYLPGVPLDWQTHQIKDSRRAIEQKLGHPIYYFCYPSGGFTDETKKIVEAAGYKGACTTNRGSKRYNEDIYELKRVKFTDKECDLSMMAKLSGYYNLFKNFKDPN